MPLQTTMRHTGGHAHAKRAPSARNPGGTFKSPAEKQAIREAADKAKARAAEQARKDAEKELLAAGKAHAAENAKAGKPAKGGK